MKIYRILASVTAVLLSAALSSASSLPDRFKAVTLPSGADVSVFSILQDPQGFMWFGTDDGLVRYDGYDCRTYRWSREDSLSIVNNVVNSLAYDVEKNLIYAGTDKGVSIYDPIADSFTEMKGMEGRHIKSFLIDGEILYVGTTTGLFSFCDGRLDCRFDGHVACVRKIAGRVWAGSYDCILELGDDGVARYDLDEVLKGKNVLVLDICSDPSGRWPLMLGTECGLVGHDPESGRTGEIMFRNVPVKTFLHSGDELWMGTDSGLAVMEGGVLHLRRHKVGEASSLPNNVVWSIIRDNAGGIWLGTDHGAATADVSGVYEYTGIDRIAGGSDGMDVRVMASDSEGRLWLGGRDGLVCSDAGLHSGFRLRSDAGPAGRRLSHNKVRGLYDDGERMWIVSDGGLDIYSHATGRVVHCHMTEPTGRYSSNWMYCIDEDDDGMMWMGTYDGGLFGVRKDRFTDAGGTVACDIHLSRTSSPALSSDIIRSLSIMDGILYVNMGNTLDAIDLKTYDCTSIPVPDNGFALSVMSDGGRLWVGADNGLYRLEDDHLNPVCRNILAEGLAFHDGRIWAVGGNMLYTYMPETGETTVHSAGDVSVMSIMSSPSGLYVGTVDGVIEVFPDSLLRRRGSPEVLLTDMWLNDRLVKAGRAYDGNVILDRNMNVADEVRLGASQNSFTFALSSLEYRGAKTALVYRLKGFDDTWRRLREDENKATFINIPSGEYVFEYAVAGVADLPGEVSSVKVSIAKVWYATTPAYVIYAVVFLILVLAVFRHIRMRHQLQMEHMERERAMAMADSKTEFLENISHEFKNPLSMILNLVSRMVASESDALRTRELQSVRQNAEKIHILLNQMVEFNENRTDRFFIPSAVSIVELARTVWDRFGQAFSAKDISARFTADEIGYIFMVDKVQMESVFQNLLSNALKFTPAGGSILMSVTVREETSDMLYVDIKVEDTGCGMAPDELPRIFSRYYMASSGREMNMEGSGLGLHIVKEVVDMHKGEVSVSSVLGKGSCFTVSLSTMKADSFILKSDQESRNWTLHSLSQIWQHRRRPIILLVEDNHDIRDLVVASLGKDYVFLMAGEGKEALEILNAEKVDLVVTDIAMPGMDGLEMCKAVRSSLKTAFLPVIVLTGKNDMQTQVRSYEYADVFISKPFDIDWLNNCIIQLLIKHEQYLEKMRQQKVIEPKVEQVASADSLFLQTIMEIVDRHIDDSAFSVASLCAESKWSDKQVYRKMKQLTGRTPTEFIRDVRLEKAAMYLSQGKLTVMEVMYKVGFTTASYFSRCFKEKYGVNPSDMAKKSGG